MASGKAIGINLSTTYRCMGVWQNDRVEIVANVQGNRTTPSYIAFTDTERLIGDAAKNQVAMNPHNTVFDAKRLIGRRFPLPQHPPPEICSAATSTLPFQPLAQHFPIQSSRYPPSNLQSPIQAQSSTISCSYSSPTSKLEAPQSKLEVLIPDGIEGEGVANDSSASDSVASEFGSDVAVTGDAPVGIGCCGRGWKWRLKKNGNMERRRRRRKEG